MTKTNAIIAETRFLKNDFWIAGKSPDNFTNNVITANPTDEISINKIPFTRLLTTYTP